MFNIFDKIKEEKKFKPWTVSKLLPTTWRSKISTSRKS